MFCGVQNVHDFTFVKKRCAALPCLRPAVCCVVALTRADWLLTSLHCAALLWCCCAAHSYGYPLISLTRAELQSTLMSSLPAEAVRLGKRCTRVEQDEQGVRAHFADGSIEEGDLLIGADGLHSITRSHVNPAQHNTASRYTGVSAVFGLTSLPELASRDGHTIWCYGPGEVWGTWSLKGGMQSVARTRLPATALAALC